MDIAERIALLRKAWGWSLGDLAAESGVSKAFLSQLEARKTSPTLITCAKLAQAFRFTVADLLVPVTRFAGQETEASAPDPITDAATGGQDG